VKTIDEIRDAFLHVHHVAIGTSERSYMSIPADPKRDADLIVMAAIDELNALREYRDCEQARLDARAEEVREACAKLVDLAAIHESPAAPNYLDDLAEKVRATPLTATPLADALRDEREVSESLRAQLHEAVERLDEFGSQPTLADGIQAMRLRLVELRARVAELEARRWIQCTSVSNECLGGCANAKEHDRHRHATLTHRAEKAEAERDEWRRQLRDAERYAAEQEMAYADLTAELAMVRAAGKELTMEFEGVEAERDALRAQVEAARTYARQALDYGEDCDASDLIRAMDEAKP
jgi:chromosome segregation ATPase